jgi:hypothetical protein
MSRKRGSSKEAKRRRNLSGNADKLLLELVLGSGVNLRVKPDDERQAKKNKQMPKKDTKELLDSYHLALDLGGIRRPVKKHDFVARIAICGGVPERQKKSEYQKRTGENMQ